MLSDLKLGYRPSLVKVNIINYYILLMIKCEFIDHHLNFIDKNISLLVILI